MGKILILAALCAANLSAITYYTCTSGNSSSSSTWSLTSGGACGAGVPASGDIIIVQTAHTLTVDASLTVGTSAAVGTDAITQQGHGNVQVSSGVTLTVRGDWTWSPVDSTDRALTLAAGSILEFDASLASSPLTTYYSLHGTGTYNYTAITANGTSPSHVIIRSNVNGGSAYLDLGLGGVKYGGGITATFTDFDHIGDALHNLTSIWTSGSFVTGNDWRVSDSTFTNCGSIDGASGGGVLPDGSNFVHQHNVHTLTLGAYTIRPSYAASLTSGTRAIIDNVFDKPMGGSSPADNGSVEGVTIEDNYFGGGFIAGGVAASWARNFSRVSTEDGSSPGLAAYGIVTGGTNITNSYGVRDDANPGHEWGVTVLGATTANLIVSGNILDSTAVSNIVGGNGNDGLVNDSTTSGQTTSLHHNISLPGADGNGIGTCADTVSSLSNITNIDHNTCFATPFGAIEYELEIPPAGVGNRGAITNNIAADLVNVGSPVNFFILQSHCPPTSNVITDAWDPTAIHHNGIYGLALTQSACSSTFTNQANSAAGAWSSTPNATGLVSANPTFVDPTRSFVAWDSAYFAGYSPKPSWYAGRTYSTWTTGTSYTVGQCVTLSQAGFYAGQSLNYCATANHTSGSSTTPGTGSSWHSAWEWATLTDLRAAVTAASTITDAGLSLSGSTYITAMITWVKAGYAPTNPAYHNAASDGTDIGAVAYTSLAPVPVVSGTCLADGSAPGTGSFPCIDDVRFNGGHSCARFTWNSDLTPTYPGQQIQYGPTSSYGLSFLTYSFSGSPMGQQETVCGLTPGSTVHFCAQTINSAGASSCSGLDQVVTFPADPGDQTPALPITTAQPYPNTAGYTTYTLDSTCSNWNTVHALACSHATGSLILVPAGQTCTANFVIAPCDEGSGGVHVVTPSNPTGVNTSDGTFTIANHGYTLNQTVRIAAANYLDPVNSDGIPTGLSPLVDYYVVNPTTSTFQLSATANGSAIVPTTTGYGSVWIGPTTPKNSANKIVIRSSAADSALPPEGVRLDPSAYASSLGTLTSADPISATVQVQPLVHDLHVGPGIEITAQPSFAAQANQFDNVSQHYLWYQYFQQNYQNIAFDRIWVHGQPCPDRTRVGLAIDGSNIQVDSSVLDNIMVCRPNFSGLTTSVASSTVSIAFGTYYFLRSTNAVSAASAVVSGSGSGTIVVTLAPGTSTPKLYLPTGVSASCTGCTAIANADLSDYPHDAVACRFAAGHITEGPIATIPVTSGVLGTPSGAIDLNTANFACDTPAGGNAEGGSAIDSVFGPGPARFTNNGFVDDIGIALFVEDTGAANGLVLSDYLTQRNTFSISAQWSPSNASTNHLGACNRNIYESKTGIREAVIGNIFSGQFGYCTPQGMSVLLASNNSQSSLTIPPVSQMADLTAEYNTVHGGSGGITITGITPGLFLPHVTRRVLVKHNLIYNIDAWQHSSVVPSRLYSTPGWCFYLGFGGEDWVIDHNTCYSVGGPNAAAVWWEASKQHGTKITNNVFASIGQDANRSIIFSEGLDARGNSIANPSCSSLSGKAAMDCSLTPAYLFVSNALSAGYTNTQAQLGDSSASMGGAFSGVDSSNSVRGESTVAARLAAIDWQNQPMGNYRMRYTSPYISGAHVASDGLDVGADIDALEAAQGRVSNVHASNVGSTSATVEFLAPDSFGCTVDWGAGSLSSYTRVANAGGSRVQAVPLTGLPIHSTIAYRVNCATQQPTGTVQLQ